MLNYIVLLLNNFIKETKRRNKSLNDICKKHVYYLNLMCTFFFLKMTYYMLHILRWVKVNLEKISKFSPRTTPGHTHIGSSIFWDHWELGGVISVSIFFSPFRLWAIVVTIVRLDLICFGGNTNFFQFAFMKCLLSAWLTILNKHF